MIQYLIFFLLRFQDTSIPEQESDQDYKSGNIIEEVPDSWLGAYVHGAFLNKETKKQTIEEVIDVDNVKNENIEKENSRKSSKKKFCSVCCKEIPKWDR